MNRWATTASVVALVVAVVAAAWVEVVQPLRASSPSGVVAAGAGPAPTLGSAPADPGLLAPAFPPAAAPMAPGTAPGYVPAAPGADPLVGSGGGAAPVRFVYFVELGEEADPAAEELIIEQAFALQQFWYDQFGGTFAVADTVEVIYGQHPATWYDQTPSGDDPRWYRLMNIRAELESLLGLEPSDRFVVYPAARIDGRVGANRYGGAVMDGDDVACISGAVDTTPYSTDYPADCLATVAHELGHVFGLNHEGPDEDCMQFGFYRYVAAQGTCQFSAANRSIVLSDPANAPWLSALPGQTVPAGSTAGEPAGSTAGPT